jgi:hypothetical protein
MAIASEVKTMVAEIQTLIAGGLARKTELVEMAGGLYPLPQVASLLNISEEAVEDRHKAGVLIAVRSGGIYGYPACQFTSDGIIEGLAVILEAMPMRDDWMRFEWLLVPDDALEGLSPLEALKEGRIDDVIDVARAQGAE